MEIEIKFPLIDRDALLARLRDGGEQLYPETFEDNVVLDRRDELRAAGALLRIRRFGKYTLVTWKGPATYVENVRKREEIQGGFESFDFAISLFRALGFEPAFRYQKLREVWRFRDTEVVLDRTPIGDYFEIEGSMDTIQSVVKELGLRVEDAVRASYMELYRQARLQDPLKPEHMVFELDGSEPAS